MASKASRSPTTATSVAALSLVCASATLGCAGSSVTPPRASDDAPALTSPFEGGVPVDTTVAPKPAADEAAPLDAGSDASSPSGSAAATAINTIEDCATFGRFPEAHVAADAGAGGPKVVIPWMVDPFGDANTKRDKPGKTEKPSKKPPVDAETEALREKFRKCHAAAKKADPTQSVGLSFSHKPKGGEHEVCVEVKRQEGKEAVTRVMATCMMQAIKEWAKVP